ncbi:hypothetical protein Alg215_08948 [Pyrenophora tritici-repentis]|nr:hypothetical protein Alg215_08948 [Pyrenophora tritici-repentis]
MAEADASSALNASSGDSIEITFTHHSKPIAMSFPQDATIADLSERVSTTLSIPPSHQKFLIAGNRRISYSTRSTTTLLVCPSLESPHFYHHRTQLDIAPISTAAPLHTLRSDLLSIRHKPLDEYTINYTDNMSYNMGYYLFTDLHTKTAPPITITATTTTASATMRAATTFITPPSNYRPPFPSPKLPFATIAETLTSHLFSSTPLPLDLAHYTPILLAFTAGAVVGTGIYTYIHRYKISRAKVKLAIFHMVHWLENLPNIKQRFANPKELIAFVQKEVDEMVKEYGQLSKSEGKETVKAVKRTIWGYVDEKIRENEAKRIRTNEAKQEKKSKRRKVRAKRKTERADEIKAEMPSSPPRDVRDGGAPTMSQAAVGEYAVSSSVLEDEDVKMTGYDSHTPAPTQESELPTIPNRVFEDLTQMPMSTLDRNPFNYPSDSSSPESIGDVETLAPSAIQGRSTYKYAPSSSGSFPERVEDAAIPTPSTPDQNPYNYPSDPSSPEAVEEAATPVLSSAQGFSKYLLNNSILRRAPKSTELLPSVQPAQTETSTKAVRPTIQFPAPYSDTLLCTLPEGISPQQSPPEGTTQYRAAGTKKMYREIEQGRSLRRGIRNFFGMKNPENEEEAKSSTPIASPAAQEV